MTARRAPAVLLLAAVLAGAGPALADGCDEIAQTPQHRVFTTVESLRRLDARTPVLLWLGPESLGPSTPRLSVPTALVRRLTLKPGSVLVGVSLANADLTGWKAPDVRLVGVDLGGALLRDADLSRACVTYGSLERTDLTGARLREIRIQATRLAGATFRKADLEGAVLACGGGEQGGGCEPSTDEAGRLDLREAQLARAEIAAPVGALGARLDEAVIDRTTLPFDPEILAAARAARARSVAIVPPEPREGDAELFGAADLEAALALIGSDPAALFETVGATPAIDCGRAGATPIETLICRSPSLTALDHLMAETWRRVEALPAGREAERVVQAAFLRRRDACPATPEGARDCVRPAYVERLAALGLRLRDGLAARFGDKDHVIRARPVRLRAALRGQPLAERLLRAWGTDADGGSLRRDGADFALDASTFGAEGSSCAFVGTVTLDESSGIWRDADDPDSLGWVVLPDGVALATPIDVAQRVCGPRAGWPAAFFFE